MMKTLILNKFIEESDIYDEMVLLAWTGNMPVLKQYIEKAKESYSTGFNKLHVSAITGVFDGSINRFSVIKKANTNMMITPLHLACVNPDVQVLRKLYGVSPEYSVADF